MPGKEKSTTLCSEVPMQRFIAVVALVALVIALGGTLINRPTERASSGSCTSQDVDQADQTITGQTTALSRGDFSAAHTFASNSFRSRISPSEFEGIITVGYEFLTRNPTVTIDRCDILDESTIRITALFETGSDSVSMQYNLVRENGFWLIETATRAKTPQVTT
ncbi:MAG: DUF4864 domain-containing protein [Candidatus Nanopelagicales bacterium]|nr:DUF4864 domain-containing protein [Candidatus Nanopelagicales bacterium]